MQGRATRRGSEGGGGEVRQNAMAVFSSPLALSDGMSQCMVSNLDIMVFQHIYKAK